MTPADPMAFVGLPPLWRPEADEVHVSVACSWDLPRAEHLVDAWGQYYPVVKIGGPALGHVSHEFVPGRYVKEGVTFTTRGCNNRCPWCLVPAREGKLHEIEDFSPGHIIQDNNILQASDHHLERVIAMLKTQRHGAVFAGGLDAREFLPHHADLLQSAQIDQLFFSADTERSVITLRRAVERLSGLPKKKIRCYVLIGFDGELLETAERRLVEVWEAGAVPYAMLYQPADQWIDYCQEWKTLARAWRRPAAIASMMKNGTRAGELVCKT